MYGFQFNTIGVSDGMSMGTRGMTYSLPSREIIADSIESAAWTRNGQRRVSGEENLAIHFVDVVTLCHFSQSQGHGSPVL